ncbi:MAG TPA: hypothetical protein VK646_00880 [Actinomycetota bacterium]|nr:hypothetical protein [Actinomycetota bacterium]
MTAREVGRALLYPYAIVPEPVVANTTRRTRRRRERRSPRPAPDLFFSAPSNFDPPGIGRHLR